MVIRLFKVYENHTCSAVILKKNYLSYKRGEIAVPEILMKNDLLQLRYVKDDHFLALIIPVDYFWIPLKLIFRITSIMSQSLHTN